MVSKWFYVIPKAEIYVCFEFGGCSVKNEKVG